MKRSIYLLIGLFLFVVNQEIMRACGTLNPTARITGYSSTTITNGQSISFSGLTSSDNDEGGYEVRNYWWYVDGAYKQSGSGFNYTFELPYGADSKTYQVKLKVRDDEGQYGYRYLDITVNRDSKKFFYLKDHLGSTRAVVEHKDMATVVETNDYYPFGLQMPGKKVNMAMDKPVKEGFTGKERDAETGWDYFGARYYDAAIGKWLSVDPLSEKYHNYSSYNYVLGNPLIYFDPDGKQVRGESYVFKKHWKNLKDPMHPELAQYYIKFYSVTLGAASLATLPVSSGMSLIYSSAGLAITYATGENDDRLFNTVTFALGAATTDVRLAITIGTVQLIVDICSDPNFKSQKQDDFMSADNTGVDLPSEVRSPVEYRIYKKDGKWVVELVKKDEIDEEQSEYEDYFDKNWKDTNVKYYEPVTGASTIFIKEALQTNENE